MDPLRVALLTSRHAPGLDRLLADPNRGSTWELSLVVGSETSFAEEAMIEAAGVPLELRPIRAVSAFRNLRAREDYDDELGELLARGRIDVVLLAGYQYILTPPMLARYPGKIFAVHDADLSLRSHGKCYAGPHAVRDAIFAGEPETRSTVYSVTGEVAEGPMLLLSGSYPLAPMALAARERGDAAFLTRYAEMHRQWMVTDVWGTMLVRALELLVAGTIQVVGSVIWVDGAPGPCRMGEAPRDCYDPETMVARGIPRSCPFIAS